MNRRPFLVLTASFCLCIATLVAQQPAGSSIDPRGVPGTRLIAGGGKLPDEIYERFLELAGGKERARIVLVPTASGRADSEVGRQRSLERWQEAHPGYAFEILHTHDRDEANREAFVQPLKAATGVWFGGGAQARLAAAYVGTRVEKELHALLARGGIVGGSSAGAAIQSRVMIEKGKQPPVLGTGFDLLPDAIVDQHFLKRNRLPRLVQALSMRQARFGVGIDEGTAILVRGRAVQVLGDSQALFVLPASTGKAQRVLPVGPGGRVDLVTWQRAARQRAQGPWPTEQMAKPIVKSGSLVIVGGGRLPDSVLERFFALAGGKDKARIVIAPTAMGRRARAQGSVGKRLQAMGAQSVSYLMPTHPSEVTDEHIEQLDRATAVWFGGGRQWRIVDAFEGTDVPKALHRVLARGGVIGGSSAGSTIQGDLLVRGDPLGNRTMWCEGYDRGYAFLPGCAIDQHFVARKRQNDMRRLLARFPQVVGLGIDEGTAAIVSGSTLEAVGDSVIAVFDAKAPGYEDGPTWLQPGSRWDLAKRQLSK